MLLSEVQIRCVPGQFWAELNPLTLHQVTEISPYELGTGATLAFRSWIPGTAEESQSCYVLPLSNVFRLLWHDAYVAADYFYDSSRLYPGDVLCANGVIWFVGPSDKPGLLRILSDSNAAPPQEAQRIQAGILPPPANRYEVLLAQSSDTDPNKM